MANSARTIVTVSKSTCRLLHLPPSASNNLHGSFSLSYPPPRNSNSNPNFYSTRNGIPTSRFCSLFNTSFNGATFSSSTRTPSMPIKLRSHAFARNPIRSKTPKPQHPLSPDSSFESLKSKLLAKTPLLSSPDFKILPFRKGWPLVSCNCEKGNDDSASGWGLGWISLADCQSLLALFGSQVTEDLLVYLGSSVEDDAVYWAIDFSGDDNLAEELGQKQLSFIELRTLMVATNWADSWAMGQLAVAGHGRALLDWHRTSRFCGHCGERTVPTEAGKRRECSNQSCKLRIFPRVDPVVIMLVIDQENDRALLSRQSRYVPRKWSCLAGFMEPGESLEEAVIRETLEETGIEVGEVIYHSSQPWPVGRSTMPCQLMVGFFAYAKSLDIKVDKAELEDAQWHNREDVKRALTLSEYEKTQRTAAAKVEQMCKGVESRHNQSADFNSEDSGLASMFFPGPYAIAHQLISSWAYQDNGK
ncbi:nudix hydrolase 19, chloroplastic-like [Benincasa hispida]|uniref:nudix hydrolase 19, chloroplastic-like n=1 Tax=Benincasa hispida TaxID=102211 RepID=UPI0019018412|nr:nudix hydrolase 19, chloroplastic-like [Benincasa hispida]